VKQFICCFCFGTNLKNYSSNITKDEHFFNSISTFALEIIVCNPNGMTQMRKSLFKL